MILFGGVNTDSGNKSKPAEHSSLEKFRDKVDKEKVRQFSVFLQREGMLTQYYSCIKKWQIFVL